jgi:hydroxypyruvate reductase
MDYAQLLRDSFDAAVRAADPAAVIAANLPPPDGRRTWVVGAGKAAASMAQALENVWVGPEPLQGLVVTRHGHRAPTRRIQVIEAGHPLPDAAGVAAAADILRMVQGLQPEDRLIVLLSGGGSSLLTLPAAGISLEDYRDLTTSLLRGGVPIPEFNIVRKHLSSTQGGWLAAATRAEILALIISDVPGDDLSAIASGPCSPDPSTYAQALDILRRWNINAPASIRAQLQAGARGDIPETPKPGDPCFARTQTRIIASARGSLAAGERVLTQAGIEVTNLGDALTGEASTVAASQAQWALAQRRLRQAGAVPCALLSGGECTVTVHGAGRGGRCSEFLLKLFIDLQDATDIYALACDTDGIDGSQDNAGAAFSARTYEHARALSLDARRFLQNNDAYPFFEAVDGLIVTGPTRTNVNDYRCVLVV